MNENKNNKNIKMGGNKNFIKIFLVLLISISTIYLIKYLINKTNNISKNKNEPTPAFNQNIETYNASILAAGDVMVHSPQLKAQYDSSTNTYSFDNNFKYVKKYVEKADYSIANLETTLSGNDITPYSSYPLFNSPDELADALKNAGFDMLSTINNHSFDKGDLGVIRTLQVLKEKGFDSVGTRENNTDDEFIIKNINDINIGITSYSYGEIKNNNKYLNGIKISEENENNMNIFTSTNVDEAFKTINATIKKMEHSDMQIVVIHWGIEYTRNEIDFQKKLAQKLCDAGIDIIIGSHPHVVEPVEMISSNNGKNKTLVIYSLGNFISNQSRNNVGIYSEDGLMVNIDITKENNNDEAKIKKVTCIPTWVHKYNSNNKTMYEIVPIENKEDLNSITNLNEFDAQKSYNNTTSLINTSDLITVVESPFK